MKNQFLSDLRSLPWRKLWLAALLLGTLIWVYWPTFRDLAHEWADNPEYSHGYLVPAFAVILLWMRRERCKEIKPGIHGLGLLLIALGGAIRFVGNFIYFDWLDAAALLPTLAGIIVLVGGKPALRWAWPAILFLVYMIPLPFQVRVALTLPLQKVATAASTYCLQTLGFPALAEGTTIRLNENVIGVVAACSGLSMLVIFFALSTAVALVIKNRPLWQKLALVVSAVPIALIANVARITATGIAYETFGRKVGDLIFHDLAGWLMMPFALVIMWLELKLFDHLFEEVAPFLKAVGPSSIMPNTVAGYKSKNSRSRKKNTFFPPLPHNPRKS
jgi:exosortase